MALSFGEIISGNQEFFDAISKTQLARLFLENDLVAKAFKDGWITQTNGSTQDYILLPPPGSDYYNTTTTFNFVSLPSAQPTELDFRICIPVYILEALR